MSDEIKEVIIGHSNTFHDPSLAVCYKIIYMLKDLKGFLKIRGHFFL